jgi:hypothetical protein
MTCDNCGDPVLDTEQRAALLNELRQCRDGIDAAYWIFSRTAQGQPPCLAVPHLYKRKLEIETALGLTP